MDFLKDFRLEKQKLNEKIEFLIEGILPKKMITTLYANGGSGKSFFALCLLKILLKKEEVKAVVYIDLDNPLGVLVDRGIEDLFCPKLTYIHRSCISCITPMELIMTIEEKALGNTYDGVVFILDSLRNFTDIDNDSKAMGLMNALMNIREAGGSIFCLHHSNKDGRGFKGSNHIHNSSDCMFALERLEGELNINLIPTKERVGLENKAFAIDLPTLDLRECDGRILRLNEREKDFIKNVLLGLKKHQELSQTQILLSLGVRSDDKYAREKLKEFDGVFWESFKGGKDNAKKFRIKATYQTDQTCQTKQNRDFEVVDKENA